MTCDTRLPSKQDLYTIKDQAEFIAEVGTGRDANNNDIDTATNSTTQVTVKTIPAIVRDGTQDIQDVVDKGTQDIQDVVDKGTQDIQDVVDKGTQDIGDAVAAAGFIFLAEYSTNPEITQANQYVKYNGDDYAVVEGTTLPYQVDSTTYPSPNDDTGRFRRVGLLNEATLDERTWKMWAQGKTALAGELRKYGSGKDSVIVYNATNAPVVMDAEPDLTVFTQKSKTSYKSVDEMKSSIQILGQLVETQGFHSEGDGGALCYEVVLGTADGDVNHQLSSGLMAKAILPDDKINGFQFGLVSDFDGSAGTDNSSVYERVLHLAQSSNNVTIRKYRAFR